MIHVGQSSIRLVYVRGVVIVDLKNAGLSLKSRESVHVQSYKPGIGFHKMGEVFLMECRLILQNGSVQIFLCVHTFIYE